MSSLKEQKMKEFEESFFTKHEECEDGFYSCPKADNYFGSYENIPLNERPCYCPVENSKVKIKQFLSTLIDEVRRETEKAFGGCKKCYGKGYGTSNEDSVVLGDFEGDKLYHHKTVQMIFCTCGRGQQLKTLLATHTTNEK